MSLRKKLYIFIGFGVVIFLVLLSLGFFIKPSMYATDFTNKLISPNLEFPFGTDNMGRNMLIRSFKGLSTSLLVRLSASALSCVISLVFALIASLGGKKANAFVLWLIDIVQGIPQLILIVFISVMLGKGIKGVFLGVALTHWPSLARVIRAEILSLKSAQFIKVSSKLGMSKFQIAYKHIFAHVIPQLIIGLVLMFPHAIMHEASITFLGFGIPLEQPAIGVILSESMQYIMIGKWWLALFPGLLLLVVVLLFDKIGDLLVKVLNPHSARG